ncbi:MAG: SAM-dependent methyltransferase, partial [Pseudomonadota bacterium]
MRSGSHAGGRDGPAAGEKAKKRQRHPGRGPNLLRIIGLGPGLESGLSGQARQALASAEVVIGYKSYVEQVEACLEGKEVLASGMTRELERAGKALDLALAGRRVALVSGGDPGIYAMAGVVFELVRARG